MRVLVTGASGFAGVALTQSLAEAGIPVRAAARQPAAIPGGARIERVTLPDLAMPFDWTPLLEGVNAVVHLAGIAHSGHTLPEASYDRINRDATRELAAAAARQNIGRLTFISSIRAQTGPAADHVLRETDEPHPIDAYGRSKLAAERAIAESGVAFTLLRPVVMYGRGVKGNLAALQRLASSSWPLPFGALRMRRSFLAIENFISAVRFALGEPRARNKTYLVADKVPFSLAEIVTMMRAANGRRAHLVAVPRAALAFGLTALGRGEAWERLGGALIADPGELLTAGWQPTVKTEEAIAAWAQAASKSGTASRSTR